MDLARRRRPRLVADIAGCFCRFRVCSTDRFEKDCAAPSPGIATNLPLGRQRVTPTNIADLQYLRDNWKEWLAGIDRRTARVGIIGLGYVVSSHSALQRRALSVTGFDIDTTKVVS